MKTVIIVDDEPITRMDLRICSGNWAGRSESCWNSFAKSIPI